MHSNQETGYLSQDTDYVGYLNEKLRDLHGFAVLAYELIQNADDAAEPAASRITFDISQDALVVENDGVFSDCGMQAERECPWRLDRAKEYRCDFHALRHVSGADKRRREGTTGAFGIGFISAYQISNHPQVVSAGRHWEFHPEDSEERRVQTSADGTNCAGTRVVLRWARENDALRGSLGVPRITDDDINRLQDEIVSALPYALLFLRNIRTARVTRDGMPVADLHRHDDANAVAVDTGSKRLAWSLFEGTFEQEAAGLRQRYGGVIESKKRPSVRIAVPKWDADPIGVYCATLPTRLRTGMPLWVNADFYPSPNRKGIPVDEGYEGEWNRAAVTAAAKALATALPDLPDLLGPERLWALLRNAKDLRDGAKSGRDAPVFACYWDSLLISAKASRIVPTSTASWAQPQEACYLLSLEDELPARSVLEDVGLTLADPRVNEHQNLIREIGIRALTASGLAAALRAGGHTSTYSAEQAPAWLSDSEQHRALAQEIGVLLDRRGASEADRRSLAQCTLARACDGSFRPPAALKRCSEHAASLLSDLGAAKHIVDAGNPAAVIGLSDDLSAETLADIVEDMVQNLGATVWKRAPDVHLALLDLIVDLCGRDTTDRGLRLRISRMPIWPSGMGLYGLASLVVPGDFGDPLQIATVLDERVAVRHGATLTRSMDACALTFAHYVGELAPAHLSLADGVSVQQRRQFIDLLVEHTEDLKRLPGILPKLRSCELVPCMDGVFRRGTACYFDTEAVRAVLGDTPNIAMLPPDSPTLASELFSWLGVAKLPQPHHIVERVSELAALKPIGRTRDQMVAVFRGLAACWDEFEKASTPQRPIADQLTKLKALPWLPVASDVLEWHRPDKTDAVFRHYLCETTGHFLDVDREAQESAAGFIRFLGVRREPTASMVVDHLINCARRAAEVNKQVYQFLGEHADDPAVTRLRSQPCVQLADGTYADPSRLFWQPHGFSPHLLVLDESFEKYRPFLKAVEVRERPERRDIIAVLQSIASENQGKVLDECALRTVREAWCFLAADPGTGASADELGMLRGSHCVPDGRGILEKPEHMFVEDRPSLAGKFGEYLRNNVVAPDWQCWPALNKSGVRKLTEVVRPVVLDRCEVMDDQRVSERLDGRADSIARVVASADHSVPPALVFERLKDLSVVRCDRLVVGYEFVGFGRPLTSEPESPAAFLDNPADALLIVGRDASPWLEMAACLSNYLLPEANDTNVAAAVALVLSAESNLDAARSLDALGVPPSAGPAAPAPQSAAVTMGGSDELPTYVVGDTLVVPDEEDEQPLDDDASVLASDEAPDESAADPPSPPRAGTGASPVAPGRSGEDTPQQAASRDARVSADLPAPHAQSPRQARASKTGASCKKQRGRLPVYVYPDGYTAPEPGARTDSAHDTAVERAGVEAVLAFEQQHGRTPTEMPYGNEGYDLEVHGTDGTIERFIEVKSISETWGETGAPMTRPQFEFAKKEGQRFWLYVVERAGTPEARIHAIQDPAGQVTVFAFDEGWRALASDDEAPVALPAPRSIRDLATLADTDSQQASDDDEDDEPDPLLGY